MIRAALYTQKNDYEIIKFELKEMTSYFTNDYLEILDLSSSTDYRKFLIYQGFFDIICIDVTLEHGIKYAEQSRKMNPMSQIIIIADQKTSPIIYLTPTIIATSLLLKPLQELMIKQAMKSIFGYYIIQEKNETDLFIIENSEYKQRIPYSQILFFEAKNKKIYACTANCEYAFYDTLNHLEKEFSGEQFIRCHRSFIVNRKMISNIKPSKNHLELQGKIKIPLSRSYKKAIKNLYNKHS